MAVVPTATVRASADAARELVSPMQYATATDWRRAVHDAMRTLFQADQAMTILPGVGELVVSQDFDDDALASLRSWFDGFTPEGRLAMSDPVVNEWNDRRRELGLQVYTRDIINHAIGQRVLASPFVNEALFPNRIRYWQGVYATGPGNSDAILWVSHAKAGGGALSGDAAIAVLSVLAPAFQAGLFALNRLDSARAAFDAVAAPLIVLDRAGRELHRSREFADLIAADPAGAVLVWRARLLAAAVHSTCLNPKPGERAPGSVAADVLTPSGRRYALSATLLPEHAFGGGECVAVVVAPRHAPKLPLVTALEADHGLTRREAQVALKLATGATRKEIAAALGISPHTARAHTEKVFQKLGVTTRAAVALRILHPRATQRSP